MTTPDTSAGYQAVVAVSLTGLFPGFAQAQFIPEHLVKTRVNWLTYFVQRCIDERIVEFDPIEIECPHENVVGIPLCPTSPRYIGDEVLYVYALAQERAVVGSRKEVCTFIRGHFDEIAPYPLAARTAAAFARLTERIPEVNRRAFGAIAKISEYSAMHWRTAVVFHAAVSEQLAPFGIVRGQFTLRSCRQREQCELVVQLPVHVTSSALCRQIKETIRASLVETGLWNGRDRLRIVPEPISETASPAQPKLVHRPSTPAEVLLAAKEFLDERVLRPALQDPSASKSVKDVVRNTRKWVFQFRKIGDLVQYIERFRPGGQLLLPLNFPDVESRRLEDVHAEFMQFFGAYRSDETRIQDFNEGQIYSAFDLAIFTRTYNNQSGGIRPVGKLGRHKAVVVTATMSGGKYANEWIEPGVTLKYYLKSRSIHGVPRFDEMSEANRSIIDYPGVSILLFTRENPASPYVYRGVFTCVRTGPEDCGTMWCELTKSSVPNRPEENI